MRVCAFNIIEKKTQKPSFDYYKFFQLTSQ